MERDVERELAGEIEITPEMIEAGVNELALTEPSDEWASTVAAVYRAMEIARQVFS